LKLSVPKEKRRGWRNKRGGSDDRNGKNGSQKVSRQDTVLDVDARCTRANSMKGTGNVRKK